MQEPTAHIALLVDFANLSLGMAEAGRSGGEADDAPKPPATRDVAKALVSYAGSLGRVGVSRAYADWARMPTQARQLGGTRLSPVLVPASEEGEDRSHIKLTVDAMETLFNGDEPDAYVLVSGDATLLPLVEAIRSDGSEVHVVATEGAVSPELREACDTFVTVDQVLSGDRADAILPRAWRTDPPAGRAAPSEAASNGNGKRERTYQGPMIREPEFEDYDWTAFISLIDELEQRLPFVGVRYLVNKVLAPHNSGVSDPRIKRDLINQAVDDGLIEMYQVGNVDNRTDPVTACRLDRESSLVQEVLGDPEEAIPAEAAEAGSVPVEA